MSSAILYAFVVFCAVGAIVLGVGYYIVQRLMETEEDELLRKANDAISNRKRIRPF